MRRLASLLLLGISGCSAASNSPSDGPNGSPALAAPVPAYTFQLEAEHTIDVYDLGAQGVLLGESGRADQKAVLPAMNDKNLPALFATLVPNTPVPDALRALQARINKLGLQVSSAASPNYMSSNQPDSLTTIQHGMSTTASGSARATVSAASRPASDAGVSQGDNSGSKPPKARSVGSLAPANEVGCTNGCCDDAWLRANMCANSQGGGNGVYDWIYENAGYSWENSTHLSNYFVGVCSAVGSTQFYLNVTDGSGFSLPVTEAHWQSFDWGAGCWPFNCPNYQNANYTATSGAGGMHSACGQAIH